jgi:hypothetical protein
LLARFFGKQCPVEISTGFPFGQDTSFRGNVAASDVLALAGRLQAAKETFSRAIAFANDVGLLSEEVDPATRELLGNFPQAFSHIGLVNAAWTIAQSEQQIVNQRNQRIIAPLQKSA